MTKTTLASSAANFDEADLLAAFNASAPVDASSYFPPPASGDSRSLSTSPVKTLRTIAKETTSYTSSLQEDDDDPFGLNRLSAKQAPTSKPAHLVSDDDDILGMLGKPVSEVRREEKPGTRNMERAQSPISQPISRRDKAIAELIDMGFPIERSREALANTEDGVNVQEAVGWLLNQAHEESRSKSNAQGREARPQERGRQQPPPPSRTREEQPAEPVPQWMRRQDIANRNDSRSPASSEKDVTQYANDIGVSFLKSASSLWKTGQKKVQKVVTELHYESDGSQPKWMRDAQQSDSDSSTSQQPIREQKARAPLQPDVTDEALMLEGGRGPAKRPSKQTTFDDRLDVRVEPPARRPSPLMHSSLPERSMPRAQLPSTPAIPRASERVSRQLVEEQSAEAYISPARRRKAAPKAVESQTQPSMDIFSDAQGPLQSTPLSSLSKQPTKQERTAPIQKASIPVAIRPNAPSRLVPSITSSALSISASKRAAGTASFKRGDYAEAHGHYTSALTPLPPTHPLAIVVRCNRALTNIKVGDPKAAIVDADAALEIIGVSRGEDEFISIGDAEGDKPMKEFFAKALSRKAEALEAMEKWTDAASVWRDAIEAGVGGSVAIQGRNRCEKASEPRPAASTQARPAATLTSIGPSSRPLTSTSSAPRRTANPSRPSGSNGLGGNSSGEPEAVKRLREANAAAAAASDEAFALTDVVDARLAAWKGGKADNLRALLASLDAVLWAEAGWKKVGMADLVMPPRVKVTYMKAIAKVHPDKVCGVCFWGRIEDCTS